MERRGHVQRNGSGAQFLSLGDGQIHRRLVAGDHHIAKIVVIGDGAHACGATGLSGHLSESDIDLGAHEGRHGP